MTLTNAANQAKKRTTAELQKYVNAHGYKVGKTYRTRQGDLATLTWVGPFGLRGSLQQKTRSGITIAMPWSWHTNGKWLETLESRTDLMEAVK
jgi:hypothetical protein